MATVPFSAARTSWPGRSVNITCPVVLRTTAVPPLRVTVQVPVAAWLWLAALPTAVQVSGPLWACTVAEEPLVSSVRTTRPLRTGATTSAPL